MCRSGSLRPGSLEDGGGGAAAASLGSNMTPSGSVNHHPAAADDNSGEYRYELRGVVAHVGTADSGHYYSFIRSVLYMHKRAVDDVPRERVACLCKWLCTFHGGYGLILSMRLSGLSRSRCKNEDGRTPWFEYNDQLVLPFDEDNIPRECFGGVEAIGGGTTAKVGRSQLLVVVVREEKEEEEEVG